MSINPKDIYGEAAWNKMCDEDPTLRVFEAASQWQKGYDVAQTYLNTSSPLADFKGIYSDSKRQPLQWRLIQEKCWELYRTFGPVNASIGSKADYAASKGFGAYSDNLDIDLFLKDLIYSFRNRLYYTVPGWMIRMQGEGELFLLLAFSEEGKVTVRVVEPSRIGSGETDDGLFTDPDDATQTLFYSYNTASGSEIIPDIRIAFEPELAKKASVNLKLTEKSKGGSKFKELGGYRRFILHWKNLTGIPEYKRDISVLSTVLESVNLYWNAIKWQLDHKKAQCAYTNVLTFEDSPTGRIAWQIWKKMTDAEKAASGLTAQLTPGSTIVLMPGLTYDVKAPQLTKLSGENQDLLNIAGAGARTPQDLWQGDSAGATHSSLRSSRSPLEMEIENLQYKLGNFFLYEFLRACFHVAAKLKKLPALFDKEHVESVNDGKPKFKTLQVEPIELVQMEFPTITFENDIERKANAYLGSQHTGLSSIGVSDDKIARTLGIDDLSRQKRTQMLERKVYGEPKVVYAPNLKPEAPAQPGKPKPAPAAPKGENL